jgi:tetratricopeptide (TPR) repeat protein
MVTILVRLADLEFLSPHDLSGGLSTSEIVDVIHKQFGYLPGQVDVEINDGVATIQFEEASEQKQMEARRLLEKAAKRAKSGEFRKAQDIYERVLDLDPAMADARRELAMTLFELGDMSAAKDQLIDALRFKPDDAWSYVVLGNIYVKHDRDFATAARFFTRALELKPGDPYALNSLAAASQELGDPEKALRCFDEAIASHPEFANAWVGKAMLLHAQDKPAQVVEVLDSMFSRAEVMDTRSQPIFAEGRKLYLRVQHELAEAQRSDAFKALETYKAEIAGLSGYPVKVRTEEVPGQLSGVAQIAWKRGRDHHIVQVSDRLPVADASTSKRMNLPTSDWRRWPERTAAIAGLRPPLPRGNWRSARSRRISRSWSGRVTPTIQSLVSYSISWAAFAEAFSIRQSTCGSRCCYSARYRPCATRSLFRFIALRMKRSLPQPMPRFASLRRQKFFAPARRLMVRRHSLSMTSRVELRTSGRITSGSMVRTSRHVSFNSG